MQALSAKTAIATGLTAKVGPAGRLEQRLRQPSALWTGSQQPRQPIGAQAAGWAAAPSYGPGRKAPALASGAQRPDAQ